MIIIRNWNINFGEISNNGMNFLFMVTFNCKLLPIFAL